MEHNLVSFEELHLQFKKEGLVETEQETEAVLILFCHQGYLTKQVFPDTNTIWYQRTGKNPVNVKDNRNLVIDAGLDEQRGSN